MCCTLVRRHLPFESSMKPDSSVLPHSNVFESIRTSIEAYKARCSPAELAAAEATFNMLKLLRAQAIEADIGLTVVENGERWVRPSKQSRHEAAVDGAISAALVLGATIIDGPTVLRLQKEERASRPARAQQVRSSHGVVLREIIEARARPQIKKSSRPSASIIANSICNQVLADLAAAYESKRYPRRSIEPNTIYKIVRDLIRMTTEQSPKEISDD
jgi:hypothetical protein